MRERLTPLIILSFSVLLTACTGNPSRNQASLSYDVSGDQTAQSESADDDSQNQDLSSIDQPSSFTKKRTSALPGSDYNLHGDDPATQVLKKALTLMGTPYHFGGNTPSSGFDCSGLINYVFNETAGIKLPRSTREMIKLPGATIAKNQLQPGDLLFFNHNGRGRVSHAGIYLGNNEFIHSNSSGGGVRIDSLKTSYWQRSYLKAKRVLEY